ncbi:MAG TPA: hypothetical protein VGM54_17575 [Chthoniobacter sp.]|jgi:hypothetical protein
MQLIAPLASSGSPAVSRAEMSPFQRVEHDVTRAMNQRNTFLAQPPEFFREFFNGRAPTLQEKLFWIEEKVRQTATWDIFRNNLYLVVIESTSPLVHLCIRRHDGQPCTNWNHLQQIKTELIGAEHEAVELFPAESRLINTTNEYHLWAHPKSGYRFPFGFSWTRFVMDNPLSTTEPALGPRESAGALPGNFATLQRGAA